MRTLLKRIKNTSRAVRGYLKCGDVIIIAALLALTTLLLVLSLLPQQTARVAVVTVDGEIVVRLPLDVDTQYTISENGHINVIEVSDGKVRMLDANCPDGTCIGQGWISDGAEVIVCLPNRVAVTLEGSSDDGRIDAVAY